MLTSLSIRNFALIDSLEIDFTSGFSVITGETGTGKSVFLGAISMMLGQRSDAKSVREGADRCIIEGHFDLSSFDLRSFFDDNELEYDEHDCIIRRELSSSGRSRAFINDTPVSVSLLKELGTLLIDIHSQHQNLLLGDKHFQLRVLDTLSPGDSQLPLYKELYAEWCSIKKELNSLYETLELSRRDEEWLRFQLEELDGAALVDGEQEALEQEIKELTYAEDIKTALYTASNIIDGDDGCTLLQSLRDAATALARIAQHYPQAGEFSERLESNYIELKDCCNELRGRMEQITFSPERLEELENRLALIYSLTKKHRCATVGELIALTADFRKRLDCIVGGDDAVADLERREKILKEKLAKSANEITAQRKAAAETLQREITEILITLGMPLIRFVVDFKESGDFTPNGKDIVTFLFSANSSSALQPLSEVASGGEMARVMLALKSLVAGRGSQPTLIFDEIDTGISGVLAERMGRMMQKMGVEQRQVISITHLPQVAALGSSHYKVYKEERETGTYTNMVHLEGETRVREIAQMMSGEVLSDAALENARMLLSKK